MQLDRERMQKFHIFYFMTKTILRFKCKDASVVVSEEFFRARMCQLDKFVSLLVLDPQASSKHFRRSAAVEFEMDFHRKSAVVVAAVEYLRSVVEFEISKLKVQLLVVVFVAAVGYQKHSDLEPQKVVQKYFQNSALVVLLSVLEIVQRHCQLHVAETANFELLLVALVRIFQQLEQLVVVGGTSMTRKLLAEAVAAAVEWVL